MSGMDLLVQYAFALLSRTKSYYYGGDDPIQGFDCSGFVQELMKAAGEIPHSTPKMNAKGLYDYFVRIEHGKIVEGALPGTLAFFGPSKDDIVHVGFCVSPFLMIEAGGGDSTVTGEEQAILRNAFIKLRPIKYRKDFLMTIRPRYLSLTGGM